MRDLIDMYLEEVDARRSDHATSFNGKFYDPCASPVVIQCCNKTYESDTWSEFSIRVTDIYSGQDKYETIDFSENIFKL